jgi:hypothetical protein
MASTKLTRTPSTTTAVDAWTFSVWLKRSSTGTSHDICSGRNNTDGGNNQSTFSFDANDNLYFDVYNGGSIVVKFITNRKFRDNAWYHIVLDFDSSTAGARSAADRMKVWVNGIRETSFSTEVQSAADQETNFCQQNDCPIAIGANAGARTATYDGLMSHINYVAGVGYPASYFGETDATTGIWKPKLSPSVTYGTNGFFLKFNEGAFGTDSSPNGNNFTVDGSLTPTKDTPENVFATLNPLDNYYAGATLSNGNTKSVTGTSSAQVLTTMGVSKGKWYWEVKATNLPGAYGTIGICPTSPTSTSNFISSRANEYMYYSSGAFYYNGGSTGTYASYATGDIIGVAMDLDNNRLFFSKNGTWQNSADPTTSTGAYTITAPASTDTGLYFPAVGYWDTGSGTFECNFGNGYFGTTPVSSATSDESGLGIFEYTVPSGYYALCTKNINTQEYA